MTGAGTTDSAVDAATKLITVLTSGAEDDVVAVDVVEEAVRALAAHGDLPRWFAAWCSLPEVSGVHCVVNGDVPTVAGRATLTAASRASLVDTIQALRPWRKGPFALFDEFIDAEWRCSLKWARVAPHVEFRGCSVLDVGCGNGYYGLRAVDAGARIVVGVDPSVLSAVQFATFKRYVPSLPAVLLPLPFERLPPKNGGFDRVLSMGVLYHRRSPLEHIAALRAQLHPKGVLVLETLVLPSGTEDTLIPEGRRYAGMPNVWRIPSVETLSSWLMQSGFKSQLVALAQTDAGEQRVTALSGTRSLEHILDKADPSKTVEGYPRPLRAMLVARLDG